MNKIKRKIFSLFLCITIAITSFNINMVEAKADNFTLTATVDSTANNGLGAINLDWSSYSGNNVTFKGYQSKDNGATWQSISLMDYTSVKEVKVLQIYPTESASNQLKTWMETNGYGKGIIKVDSVHIDEFNSSPSTYLYKTRGEWNYDVIFFGTWDSNAGKDLNASSKSVTEQFIKDGGGCIFGHDTIRWDTYVNGSLRTPLPYFASLTNYVGISANDYWANGKSNVSTYVKILKKGLFTSYPWDIGEVGTELTIPYAHCVGQTPAGDVWLEFTHQSAIPLGDPANFYLTTYNNCAMIQTGHSSGQATEDEQKILANLIFYSYQLTSVTAVTDNSAMDTTAPNTPTINISGTDIVFSATDNGTTYNHKIEAYAKNNMSTPIATSNITTSTVTSGMKEYRYIFDNSSTTKVTGANSTATTSSSITYSEAKRYLHIAAVDNAGNISETVTIEAPKYKNKYKHYAWGFKKGEGNNSTKDGFLLQTTYGEEIYGESFTPNASYALTVPKGFYLQQKFGTDQITGKYALYNFGMTLTQPAYVMNFEYDYYPIDYTITYNLNGGTNNSNNPETYNILYGITFKEPTKKGYDFVGWYDKNGNKVTGINEGCKATFTNTADMYSSLSKRNVGNIEVTAKWEIHDYTIDTNYTGSGVISNDSEVTYTDDTSVFIEPAEGFELTGLKVDGISVNPVKAYDFMNVVNDHTIEATFTMTQTKKMEIISKGYIWIDLKLN